MYAIVNIAGQQFKVEKDQHLFVHRLEEKEGDAVSFDEVLLIDNDKNVIVGAPTIKGAMISGKVISQTRGDKIKVFKKKRRKGFKVRTGHRQYLTEIKIEDIIETGAVKKTKAADEKPADTAMKAGTVKPPVTKAEKPAAAAPAPKTAVKKTAAKKPAAKKTAAKKPAAKPAASGEQTKNKTAARKPAAAKPAAKKTTAAKPAAKKTDTEEGNKEQ